MPWFLKRSVLTITLLAETVAVIFTPEAAAVIFTSLPYYQYTVYFTSLPHFQCMHVCRAC